MITQLETFPAALRGYSRKFDGLIMVVFSTEYTHFGFYLPVDMLQRLTQLELPVVFDLYYIGPPDDSEPE